MATWSASSPASRETYSTPAPAEPPTAGRNCVSIATSSIASSTRRSSAAQKATRISVPPTAPGAASPRAAHQPGGVSAVCAPCPSRAAIRSARSLTPSGVPSSRMPTCTGAPGPSRSISAAAACSGEAAAASTASAAAAASS